jgi:hypothetical protein
MQAVESSVKGEKNDKSREWLYNYSTQFKSELGRMPELNRNGFMIAWLSEIGYYQHGAMGIMPLTHTEVMAWRSNTGTIIEPEDANMIMLLSKIYVGQYRKSSDRDEPPPSVIQVQDKIALGNKIKGAFRRIANPSK